MNLRNSFSDATRSLFMFKYDCDWCLMNGWDCLHHIMGRVSDSPLNAATLHNNKCHLSNGELHTFDSEVELLSKTYWFLITNGYILTNTDRRFIKDHKEHYSEIL